MTDDPKTVTGFEFDALPGDAPAASLPAEPALTPTGKPERKKRGSKKAAKPERKKRGPRRVQATIEAPTDRAAVFVTNTPRAGESAEQTRARGSHKPRYVKADLPAEFDFIRQMMELTEPTRKRVLAILNKVFG